MSQVYSHHLVDYRWGMVFYTILLRPNIKRVVADFTNYFIPFRPNITKVIYFCFWNPRYSKEKKIKISIGL